jgi:hypothetical protein
MRGRFLYLARRIGSRASIGLPFLLQPVNLADRHNKQQASVSPVEFTDDSLGRLDNGVYLRLLWDYREQRAMPVLLPPK